MTLFHLKVSWITMMLIHIFCFHFNLRHSKFNPMKFDHCYFGLFVLGTISVFCPSVAGVSRHFGMFPQVSADIKVSSSCQRKLIQQPQRVRTRMRDVYQDVLWKVTHPS